MGFPFCSLSNQFQIESHERVRTSSRLIDLTFYSYVKCVNHLAQPSKTSQTSSCDLFFVESQLLKAIIKFMTLTFKL